MLYSSWKACFSTVRIVETSSPQLTVLLNWAGLLVFRAFPMTMRMVLHLIRWYK
jgi:hypothetical protein